MSAARELTDDQALRAVTVHNAVGDALVASGASNADAIVTCIHIAGTAATSRGSVGMSLAKFLELAEAAYRAGERNAAEAGRG